MFTCQEKITVWHEIKQLLQGFDIPLHLLMVLPWMKMSKVQSIEKNKEKSMAARWKTDIWLKMGLW